MDLELDQLQREIAKEPRRSDLQTEKNKFRVDVSGAREGGKQISRRNP